MAIRIFFNRAMEFINAVSKYAGAMTENEWKSGAGQSVDKSGLIYKDLLDFTPSAYIQAWLKSVDETISGFMKNDMNFLFNRFGIVNVILSELIIKHGIETPVQLIARLESMDAGELIEASILYFGIPESGSGDEKSMRAYLNKNFDEDLATTFLQIKKHPDEFMEKLRELLVYFYEKHYQAIEEELGAFIEPKIRQHQALLDTDLLNFLNIIGIGDYKRYIESDYPITLFISFIIDVGMSYFTYQSTLYMSYGVNMEKRLNHLLMKEKCKNLFKALSDEKRIEIIKLTSIRPYYNKELADHFGLTTATLSYHINLLLDIGILNFEPRPNNRFYYTTNKETLKTIFAMSLEMLLE